MGSQRSSSETRGPTWMPDATLAIGSPATRYRASGHGCGAVRAMAGSMPKATMQLTKVTRVLTATGRPFGYTCPSFRPGQTRPPRGSPSSDFGVSATTAREFLSRTSHVRGQRAPPIVAAARARDAERRHADGDLRCRLGRIGRVATPLPGAAAEDDEAVDDRRRRGEREGDVHRGEERAARRVVDAQRAPRVLADEPQA